MVPTYQPHPAREDGFECEDKADDFELMCTPVQPITIEDEHWSMTSLQMRLERGDLGTISGVGF